MFSLALIGLGPVQQHDQAPPDRLKELAFMTGDWVGQQNFASIGGPPVVGKATDHVSMIVGGRFLEEKLSTTIPGRPASDTRHIMTYDPKTQQFRAWWFNDTSVDPMVLEGTFEGKRLVLTSRPGSPRTFRATYEMQDNVRLGWTLEMKVSSGWMRLFVSTYVHAATAAATGVH